MTERPTVSAGSAKRSLTLVVVACATLVVGAILVVRPASTWLRALSPDGALEAETAAFLDGLSGLVLLLGLITLAAGLSTSLREALAAGWRFPPPAARARSRWIAPAGGLLAFLVRIAVASVSDIGMGDDGARVVWLQHWLQDPKPILSGVWLPAHLYLHALFNLFIRDPVWSGVVLSASAAGGTTWILTRAVEEVWGRRAAVVTAVTGSILPISVAYGANPDNNPVFAFLVVAATAAVLRAARSDSKRWLVVGWLLLSTATWMRYDALPLVPVLGLLLWPRRLLSVLFVCASLLPMAIWTVADSLITQTTGNVVGVILQDPSLKMSAAARAFHALGAVWHGITLPILVLGVMGVVRSLRARQGRAWMVLPLAHAAALAAAAVVVRAGTQPRYFILIGTVLGAYAGVAVAGVLERSRRVGFGVVALAAGLLALTPGMFPDDDELWIRRNPELRALADEVSLASQGQDVVWIGRSAYYYCCRKRPPLERFHAISRYDYDPTQIIAGWRDAASVVVVVEQTPATMQQWEQFQQRAQGWVAHPLGAQGGFDIYSLRRATLVD